MSLQHTARSGHNWRDYCLFILLAMLITTIAEARAQSREGITLQSTRVIYPQDKQKGITFTLKNDTQIPYLIQSKVVNLLSNGIATGTSPHQSVEAPFIALPPLKRLDAAEQLTLTIRLTKNTLPEDRESVFALQIKAIPSSSDSSTTHTSGQVKVMLALQNTMKLFYRPQQLKTYTLDQIADGLSFVRQGNQLIVNNSSPYYVTFKSLAVGNSDIDAQALFQMVAPFAQQTYPLSLSATGELQWQLVNDYGRASQKHRRPLTQ